MIRKIILPLVAVLALTSCKKEDIGKITFDSDTYEVVFTIDPISQTGAMDFHTEVFQSDLESAVSANGTAIDKITSVRAKSVNFEILSPSTANFDFLDELSSSVINADGSATTFAEKTDIPDNGSTSLSLDLNSEVELKQYLTASEFSVKASGVTSDPITDQLEVKALIKFEIEADLIE